MGVNRQPGGKNITRRVHVPIVFHSTRRTCPTAHRQRQFRQRMTATRTAFAARIPAVNTHNLPAVPSAFVFQLANEFRPALIANRFRQTPVFLHVRNAQRLDGDHLVLAYPSGGQLMQKILPHIGNAGMNPCHPQPCFLSVCRTFLFLRQRSLGFCQLGFVFCKRFRADNLLPRRSDRKMRQAQIDTDLAFTGRQSMNRIVTQQGNKVPIGGILAEGDGCDPCRLGKGS